MHLQQSGSKISRFENANEKPMRLPRALLVDLDDTILDDTGSSDDLWRQVCSEATPELDRVDAGALFAAIDSHRRWYWSDPERHRVGRADLRAATRQIVCTALAELTESGPALGGAIADRYRDLRDEHLSPLPGAIEALARLRVRGVRLALLTNGSGVAQRQKIERFALAPYFDFILVEGEFGCGKPDARVYRAALQALAAKPIEAWCIGDNLEWDVAAPQREGVLGIWVDVRRQGLPPGSTVQPDRVVHALAELVED